jgi:hypothetical protein
VCTVSKDVAVVALENKSLQFVSLGEKITVMRTVKMNHECFGVAHKDGNFFIGDGCTTLYIYDMNGQKQRRITTDGSGGNIFINNQQIDVSASADRVFVADYNHGVVVLDSQGNYLLILSDRNVKGCTGVCTDGENIFVSGLLSNNIVQFGQSYTTLGEVAQIKNPWFLCFDNEKKKLIVVQEDHKNKITLLELE